MRPHEPPTYFVDHCLGTNDVAYALRAKGARVEIYLDHFAGKEELNDDWIPTIAACRWIILTKDEGWLRRGIEASAWRRRGPWRTFSPQATSRTRRWHMP